MRPLVQPPPSVRCDFCHGELLLKQVDPAGGGLELDTEIFVCAKCGRERSRVVSHDRYAAHTASSKPPAKVR
jgi:hypothetical protein